MKPNTTPSESRQQIVDFLSPLWFIDLWFDTFRFEFPDWQRMEFDLSATRPECVMRVILESTYKLWLEDGKE